MLNPRGSLAELGQGKRGSDLQTVGSFYRNQQNLTGGGGGGGCNGTEANSCRHRASQNSSPNQQNVVCVSQGSHETEKESELEPNNRTTDGQTMMHILKANIGTGVLALPLAFKNVGLWCGLVLVPVIGFICIHCMNILISSHNNLCDRFNYESLDYDQVASLGLACGPKWARRFAKKASVIVTIFLMFTQIGFCCVYILFTVENLQVACMNLFGLNYSMLTYLLAVFPVIGLTSCTSNLKHLARISTLANILQLLGLTLIFFDLLQFHTYACKGESSLELAGEIFAGANATGDQQLIPQQPTPPPLQIVVEQGLSENLASGLPLFFATAVYAFEGIGVVLPLVKEMQSPARISGLNGVLNTSMALVALLYMAMGFFGYAKYGQTVAGSITLNLPESTLNEIVRLAFALAIGLSYGLQFYIPWSYFWPLIDEALFYSYRPRVARDKLEILNKLSAENHWALHKVLQQEQEEEEEEEEERVREHEQQQQQDPKLQRPDSRNPEDSTTLASNRAQSLINSASCVMNFNDNSMATTMATSYSMSMSTNNFQQQHHLHDQRPLLLSVGGQQKPTALSAGGTAGLRQYGALEGEPLNSLSVKSHQQGKQQRLSTGTRRRRNRFEDVIEQSGDEDSLMPEVQWRPPPRSMRGKRKLVRYTVILLVVSFTFVAAALIPRLDLFISLIGALASSCLAIIFPAIIQLCTFWNFSNSTSEEEDEEGKQSEEEDRYQREGDGFATAEGEEEKCASCQQQVVATNASTSLISQQQQHFKLCKCRTRKRRLGKRRCKWRHSLAWHLFFVKNLFLVVFGFLGLITGTWVSLRQLSELSVQV